MAGGSDGISLHYLEVRGEVGIDGGVEDGEVEESDGAAGEYVAIRQQAEGEEGSWSEFVNGFPDRKDQEADAADHNHGNDASVAPVVFCCGC